MTGTVSGLSSAMEVSLVPDSLLASATVLLAALLSALFTGINPLLDMRRTRLGYALAALAFGTSTAADTGAAGAAV